MEFENKTFGQKLCEWSTAYGERIAIVDEKYHLSYSELYLKSLICANYFKKKGLKKGDKVIVQMTNSVFFPIIFFSMCLIGAIPILCLPAHKEQVIEGICENANPSSMIFTKKYLKNNYEEMAHRLAKKYNCTESLIFEEDLPQILDGSEFVQLESTDNNELLPSDVAFMLLSGGTTGIPKLIPRTHNDYLYNAEVTAERIGLTKDTVMLNILPASHNFAFGTPGIIGTFMKGGKVVMQKYPDITEFFCNIEMHRVNITSLVPALVNMCLRYRKLFDDDNIESLQYVMVGGAMFRSDEAINLEKYFDCTVVQVFGMSEGMTFITEPNATENIRFNYQGKPSSEYDEFRIVNNAGEDVPIGECGEIIVRGPYTIKGYYNNEAANKKSFNKEGYYLTGDKAVCEPGGNVRILGRIREQINRAGEKIMPSALEEWVSKCECVEQCAALGVPDDILGNKICIFAVVNQELTLEKLRGFLKKENVSDFYLPDMLQVIDQLPLTPVGKVDKNELLHMVYTAEER